MPLPRFRLRTLMLAVAGLALYLAGLIYGPVWMAAALILFASLAPVV